jgi:hypothetical protein
VLAGCEGRIERIAWRFQLERWEGDVLRRIVDLARENGLDAVAVRDAAERSVASLLAVLPPATTSEEEYQARLTAEARGRPAVAGAEPEGQGRSRSARPGRGAGPRDHALGPAAVGGSN